MQHKKMKFTNLWLSLICRCIFFWANSERNIDYLQGFQHFLIEFYIGGAKIIFKAYRNKETICLKNNNA